MPFIAIYMGSRGLGNYKLWKIKEVDWTMSYIDFGDFIQNKRNQKNITLREMARLLGISAPFLTEVEKGKRNPFGLERLIQLASILELSKEDNEMMLNLAGKKRNAVAPDLPEYIMERDYVSAAIRTARDLGAGAEVWQWFMEELKKQ